jgi:hypothetical protein
VAADSASGEGCCAYAGSDAAKVTASAMPSHPRKRRLDALGDKPVLWGIGRGEARKNGAKLVALDRNIGFAEH